MAGLTVADIRSRASVPTLKRNASVGAGDSLYQALADKRTVLAAKVIDQTVSQMESDSLESENKMLAAQIEREKLKEQLRSSSPGASGPGSEWQTFIMEELKDTRARLDDAQSKLVAGQQAAMEERMAMLGSELERMRSAPGEPEPDPIARTQHTIEQARQIVGLITPAHGREDTGRGVDPAILAYNRRMDNEALRMKISAERDAEERRERREAEREVRREERDFKEKELALKEKEMEMRTRFFSQTGPQVLEYLVRIVGVFGNQVPPVPGVPPAAIPAAFGQSSPTPALPPGVHLESCRACGAPLAYNDAWSKVTCPGCGETYTLTDSGEEPAPATQGDSATEEEVGQTATAAASDESPKHRIIH